MIPLQAFLWASLAALPLRDLDVRLVEWGPDPSRGALVNATLGARPCDPPDPARPTVVVVHGLNPFHPMVHFEMARRYGEAYGRAYGAGVNVLGWDWNAETLVDLRPRVNDRHAVAQGRALAAALRGAGVDPASVHLIGHSTGCVVAASAARDLAWATSRRVGRLTLIDPVGAQHPLIFGELGATASSSAVDHLWASGPSGFGRPAGVAGVAEARYDGPGRLVGLFRPSRLDHLNVVRWHLGTVGR